MQPNKVASTSALPNCFKCDELRHRMVDCRKGEQYGKGLFNEFGVSMDEVLLDMEKGLEFDVEEEIEEELLLQGDEYFIGGVEGVKYLFNNFTLPPPQVGQDNT
jgi:hypothetical protein